MNYKEIYDDLVTSAKERCLLPGVYFERHHIVPTSMGVSNSKDNLVDLTPREHLIAQMLVWRIHRNVSMSYALWLMSNSRGVKINSRSYEKLREDVSLQVSIKMKNKIVTKETRDKMSESFTGRIFTEEHKDNIGKSSKGRVNSMKGKSYNLTEEESKIWSNRRKGKGLGNPGFVGNHSPESIKKMKDKKTGHAPTNFKRVSINGVEYQSAVEASRLTGLTYNMVIGRIKSDNHPEYFYTN